MDSFISRLDSIAKWWFLTGIVYGALLFIWSEQYLDPLGTRALLLYAGIAVCLGFAALAPKRRIDAFMVTASAAAALILVNAYLEFQRASLPDRIRISLGLGHDEFDMRTPEEYIQETRSAGTDIVPAMCQSFTGFAYDGTILPLAGWPHRLTLLGNENGYFATYLADRFGFNNPDSVYDTRSNNRRVLLLGDSFAQGFAVSQGEDVGSVVRRRDFDVLNLGCASNGPLAQLAGLMEYGIAFEPETVVFFYMESNDLSDLARELGSPLGAYLDPAYSQALAFRKDEIEDFLERAQRELESDRARALWWRIASLTHVRGLVRNLAAPRWDGQLALLEMVMQEVRQRVTGLNAQLLIVYIPEQSVFGRDGRRDDCRGPQSSCKRRVMAVFERLDVPILDFEDALDSLEDPVSAYAHPEFGHFTDTGYRLLGERIADELRALARRQ